MAFEVKTMSIEASEEEDKGGAIIPAEYQTMDFVATLFATVSTM